jgi:hypothetical protein
MSVVQFETTREGNLIRIPEQYMDKISDVLAVTLVDVEKPRFRPKTKKEKPSSIEEFSVLKLDTTNWKFDREEANERR